MKRLVFLGFLALVGCGAEEAGLLPNSGSSGQSEAPRANASPEATESGSEKSYHSMLVADAASLPTCDEPAEGWLVYVQADSEFKACQSGSWNVVSIKGEKGDKGDAGAKGEKGDSGAQGEVGDDGVAAATNTWRDSITGKTWLLGGTAASPTGCGGDWRLPTYAEITTARNDGMYAGFASMISSSAYDCALHSEGGLNVNVVKPGASCGGLSTYGIYCVLNAP